VPGGLFCSLFCLVLGLKAGTLGWCQAAAAYYGMLVNLVGTTVKAKL
jgi:hypothetical protein